MSNLSRALFAWMMDWRSLLETQSTSDSTDSLQWMSAKLQAKLHCFGSMHNASRLVTLDLPSVRPTSNSDLRLNRKLKQPFWTRPPKD